MKHWSSLGVILFLFVAVPGLLLGQSLTELAEKEKERRRKNKESGEQVRVFTERELVENRGRIANPDASPPPADQERAMPAPPASPSAPERDTTEGGDPVDSEDDDFEEEPVTDIPVDTSLEEKLRLLERMKSTYQAQVREIDAEIQKNNQRLAEIEDELVSTGGTGLPTAPRADRTPRNPGAIPALRNEQQELRQKNQALEAQKQSAKNDIITRARRAGIPPGYLNF